MSYVTVMTQNTQHTSNYTLELPIWNLCKEHSSPMAQQMTSNHVFVLNTTITHYTLAESNKS